MQNIIQCVPCTFFGGGGNGVVVDDKGTHFED